MSSPSIDKALMKTLREYDALAEYCRAVRSTEASDMRYVEEHGTAPTALADLKAAGLAFDMESMQHDDALRRCFDQAKRLRKESVANHFIAGLARQRPDWRAAMSAYAIMQTMPEHAFAANAAGYCTVCSGAFENKYFDRTALNRMRFIGGWLSVYRTPYEIGFYLEQEALLPDMAPNDADVDLFNEMLALIRRSSANGPTELAREVRAVKALKLSAFEARGVIDTLGLCGVLSTNEHRGYEAEFTNPGVAPTKRIRSDWSYPVDFWRAVDGVNEAALRFWFGHALPESLQHEAS